MAKPTLQTIANEAGVSKMTVSRALRHDSSIPDKTRNRIKKIADKLGYTPNPMISALMSNLREIHELKNPAQLGFLTSGKTKNAFKSQQFYNDIYNGAKQRAKEMGYNLVNIWCNEPSMTPKRLNHVLDYHNIQGLLVGTLPMDSNSIGLDWSRYSLATVGFSLQNPQLHRVCNHHYHAMQLALQEVKKLGYKRIGFITNTLTEIRVDHSSLAAFYLHYHHCPEQHKVPPLVFEDDPKPQCLLDWYNQYKPEVIIGENAHILTELQGFNIKIPEECGFVTLRWENASLPCAGIKRDFKHIGKSAIEIVIKQLVYNERGIPEKPQTISNECEWAKGPTIKKMSLA